MATSHSSSSTPILSPLSLLAALAGAGGGFLSFIIGDLVNGLMGGGNSGPILYLVWHTAFWSGTIGITIGAAILVYDNAQSLRGHWHRDLLRGLPLFFSLSFIGGAIGQLSYSVVQNSLTRGIGWSLIGASIGAGIGLLRRDRVQALRGALGGVIGGFLGGFIFNGLAMLMRGDAGSRCVGQILMGALIALLMRVVQDALKSAWLLGISAGPSEGKEYPLNTSRVSMGRADDNDISLFREESVQSHMGALNFQDGQWWWKGESILVNGKSQTAVMLQPGDTLQVGAIKFRFKTRSAENSGLPATVAAAVSPATTVSSSSQSGREFLTNSSTGTTTQLSSQKTQKGFALMLPGGQMLRLPDTSVPIKLGRAPDNQLVLPNSVVSSTHASFQVVDGHLSISDLDSTNGTFVNGVRISPHLAYAVTPGDQVRFGNIETVVRSL
jgi:hypothetical protein